MICQENIQVTLIGYKIIKGLEIARAKLQRTRIKITAVRWKLELFELENSEAVWKNNIVLTGTIFRWPGGIDLGIVVRGRYHFSEPSIICRLGAQAP